MPLFQPTNIFPSSFAGVGGGVIDVTQDLTISWQVNGSSALTAYQIQIFENTEESSKVFDSGETPVNPPFYGTSSTGTVQFYNVPVQASALSGLSNGFESGYKMLITQWWSGGSLEQISPSFFWTRSEPTISIQAFTSPVTSRMATFTADYSQAQGDSLDWFRWQLAVKGSEDSPIQDSGEIFGTEDIQVTYDGLLVGTTYEVRCQIQTEYGMQADTGWQEFTVQYAVSDFTGYVEACPGIYDGILVRWSRVSYIPGTANGNYTIENGNLNLPLGSSVTWDEKNGAPMDFETPWSIAWSSFYPPNGTSPALSINRTINVNVTPDSISIMNGDVIVGSVTIDSIQSSLPLRIVITPRELHVYYATYEGGLFPSESLYPSDTLYPDSGMIIWNAVKAPLTWVQPNISSITLYGQQICQWITALDGEVSGDSLHDLLYDLQYEPTWGLDTLFLATFNDTGLNAGNITPNENLVGVALYRQAQGDSALSLVANLDISTTEIVDEGYRNQVNYTYYVFALGETQYVSDALPSNTVFPMHWNWTVLDCIQNSDGVYHVNDVHIFRNNVSTDALTNNNTPNMLQNFTPYPTRQPTSYNYISSTLTGYIGKVDMVNNRYIDTVEQAAALWELSTSTDPKFLRDRKGNFWRIETQAAITMQTGDNQAPQPYFGSIPWMESGPVNGASVICQSGDNGWNDLVPPVQSQSDTQIIVTAPVGSEITISNGTYSFVSIYTAPIQYDPPTTGEWTVSGMLDGSVETKTITISQGQTYYVGLEIRPVYAYLTVTAPSGTTITVAIGEYTETQQVP